MRRTAFLLLLVSCATVPPQKTRVLEFASPLHDSISFSGDALFLTRTTADFARSEMLELRRGKWIAVPFANGAASGAQRVASLSSGTTGGTPSPSGRNGEWPSYVDPAGRFILFSSIREGGFGGDDIYYALSDGAGGWQAPRNAGPLVNTAGYEDGPTVRGGDLFWSSRDDKSASDVYRIPLRAIVK